ncbi:hypothetical protein [Nocardia sp. NPDC003345]
MGIFSRRASGSWADSDFVPVQVPRAGLSVLDVFAARPSGYQRLGSLEDLLEGEHSLIGSPYLRRGLTVAGSAFIGEKNVKLGLGLTVLDQIAGLMGQSVSTAGAHARGETLDYEYVDVTRDEIDLFELDGWIRTADLRTNTQFGAQLAVSEKAFVAVAAQFAPTVRISITGKSDTELTVRTTGAVAGHVERQHAAQRGLTVSLTGAEPVCIALMLVRIFCNSQGFWLTAEPHTSGGWIRSGDTPYELFSGDQLVVDAEHG